MAGLRLTVWLLMACGQTGMMIDSSPPSATYMHLWIGSALVEIMACRLFGAKPLSKPMHGYYPLDSWEQISMKFESELCHFHYCQNVAHFDQGKMSKKNCGNWTSLIMERVRRFAELKSMVVVSADGLECLSDIYFDVSIRLQCLMYQWYW